MPSLSLRDRGVDSPGKNCTNKHRQHGQVRVIYNCFSTHFVSRAIEKHRQDKCFELAQKLSELDADADENDAEYSDGSVTESSDDSDDCSDDESSDNDDENAAEDALSENEMNSESESAAVGSGKRLRAVAANLDGDQPKPFSSPSSHNIT